MDWFILKGKGCCQHDIVTAESAGTEDIRNTTVDIDQWKTPCFLSITIFFIELKYYISFILHESSFEGIISL